MFVCCEAICFDFSFQVLVKSRIFPGAKQTHFSHLFSLKPFMQIIP